MREQRLIQEGINTVKKFLQALQKLIYKIANK